MIYHDEVEFRRQLKVDFKALADNLKDMRRLVYTFCNQLMFQQFCRTALTRAEAICTILGEAIGKTCTPLMSALPEQIFGGEREW